MFLVIVSLTARYFVLTGQIVDTTDLGFAILHCQAIQGGR